MLAELHHELYLLGAVTELKWDEQRSPRTNNDAEIQHKVRLSDISLADDLVLAIHAKTPSTLLAIAPIAAAKVIDKGLEYGFRFGFEKGKTEILMEFHGEGKQQSHCEDNLGAH